MKHTLYSRPFRNGAGNIAQQKIVIDAAHSHSYYDGYHYRGIHCDPKPDRLPISSSIGSGFLSWLTLARRSVLFSDVCNLKSKKNTTKKYSLFISAVRIACNIDHPTIWESVNGTVFLLNEIYTDLERSPDSLTKAGFLYIKIPLNLSPYCGGNWNKEAGSLPISASFLICRSSHLVELLNIENNLLLADRSNPEWNSVVGVSYVK